MVISNEEITNNLILYPPAEPSSSIKLRFTLTQKSPPMDELEPENEDIR